MYWRWGRPDWDLQEGPVGLLLRGLKGAQYRDVQSNCTAAGCQWAVRAVVVWCCCREPSERAQLARVNSLLSHESVRPLRPVSASRASGDERLNRSHLRLNPRTQSARKAALLPTLSFLLLKSQVHRTVFYIYRAQNVNATHVNVV